MACDCGAGLEKLSGSFDSLSVKLERALTTQIEVNKPPRLINRVFGTSTNGWSQILAKRQFEVWVTFLSVIAAGTVNAYFGRGDSATTVQAFDTEAALSTPGLLPLVVNSGFAWSAPWPGALLIVPKDQGLWLNLSAGVRVDGYLTFAAAPLIYG